MAQVHRDGEGVTVSMIHREPQLASSTHYDVLIVGGGILGACHALEAAARGLTTVLLERDDFGGATSAASQRIVHGGLRYLQSLDLARHRTSVRERRWFLKHFPGWVRPLPCLMPLYNRGLKRPLTMRAAMWMNDRLSASRNDGVEPANHLPRGSLLSPMETQARFPGVELRGLRGGVLWHDGMLVSPQRVLMEILHWACSGRANALNYVPVRSIRRTSDSAYEISARDSLNEVDLTFTATQVINAAGPWAVQLDDAVADEAPPLSLAFCLLLDRPAVSEAAVAVSPGQCGSPIYFLTPLQGRVLAGTCHLPWDRKALVAEPTEAQIETFLKAINASVPGINLQCRDVARVFAGLLPADRPGSAEPASRPIRHRHPSSRPGSVLETVWGVKYTTARAVAEATMKRLAPDRPVRLIPKPHMPNELDWSAWVTASGSKSLIQSIGGAVSAEAITCIDDLLYRRTDWGTMPDTARCARQTVESYAATLWPAAREAMKKESS